MRTALIALAAAATFGLASAASAAPIAPAQIAAKHAGNQVENVHYAPHVRRHIRRDIRRHVRRHFWAPGPWAFRGVPYSNCYPIRGGYVCYY